MQLRHNAISFSAYLKEQFDIFRNILVFYFLVDIQMRGFINSPTVHYINNQSQEKLAQFTIKMENTRKQI